jgi:hypothetical protein
MNDLIKVSLQCDLVVRRAAVLRKFASTEAFLDTIPWDAPVTQTEALIHLGPCFGGEAMENTSARLIELGLSYFDDFCELFLPVPDWCGFYVAENQQPPEWSEQK